MRKNTIKKIGISLIAIVLITGCGKVPKLENGQDAVLSINGNLISVDTLYDEMKNKFALSVLIDLMDKEVLDKEYKDTDDQKKSIDSQVQLMIQQYGQGDEQALLQQTYSAWGIDTMEGLREYLTIQYKRNLAIEDYSKTIVTDEDINKFYDEKIFGDITAKHILISPETTSSMTDAEKIAAEEAALKKAKEIISKLKNGEDFETLAKENSDDESNKKDGGKLPAFGYGKMETDFENAAKKLGNGKYTTEPVKTSYGYHIIYKESQKDKPELKTVKEDIIEEIANDKLTDDASLQITALEKLREKYKLKIEDKTLKSQYETYLKNAKESAKKSNQ